MDCLINYTDYNNTTMERNVMDFSEFVEIINERPEYTFIETMGDYLFNIQYEVTQ